MRRILSCLCLIAALVLVTAAKKPMDALARLTPGEAGVVSKVIDGDTFVLTHKGQPLKVRLVGLQAPELPHGAPTGPAGLMGPQSRTALERMIKGRVVGLYYGGNRRDRYGRALAHVRLQDQRPDGTRVAGTWVQGLMLDQGMARVYTFADNRTLSAQMYAREQGARRAKRGVWALPYYAPRPAEAVGKARDQFLIIEGRVRDAALVKGRVYLNFGANWKHDFTVLISAEDLPLLRKGKLDPLSLEGQRIRVRGWVFEKNGPMIKATHPEQIERL